MFPVVFSLLKEEIFVKIQFSTYKMKDNEILNMKHFCYYEEPRTLSAGLLAQLRQTSISVLTPE